MLEFVFAKCIVISIKIWTSCLFFTWSEYCIAMQIYLPLPLLYFLLLKFPLKNVILLQFDQDPPNFFLHFSRQKLMTTYYHSWSSPGSFQSGSKLAFEIFQCNISCDSTIQYHIKKHQILNMNHNNAYNYLLLYCLTACW